MPGVAVSSESLTRCFFFFVGKRFSTQIVCAGKVNSEKVVEPGQKRTTIDKKPTMLPYKIKLNTVQLG